MAEYDLEEITNSIGDDNIESLSNSVLDNGFLESLPELVFELLLNGRINYVNQSGLEKFGYEKASFLKEQTIQSFFPYDHNNLIVSIKKVINNENFEKKTYLALNQDGSTTPVVISSIIIKKNGQPHCLRGMIFEISNQKDFKNRFRSLFNLSPLPAIIFRYETGEITILNKAAQDLFEIDEIDSINENIFFYMHDFGKLSFRNYIQIIQQDKDSHLYITYLSTKKGVERKVEIISSQVLIGDKYYIQSFVKDITETAKRELKEIEQRKQKELLALSVFQLNQYKDKDSLYQYIVKTLFAFIPDSTIIIGDYIQERNTFVLHKSQGLKIEQISKILNIDINKFELDYIDYPTPENRIFVDIEKVLAQQEINMNLSGEKLKLVKEFLKSSRIFTTKFIANQKILGGIAIFTANENFLEENEFIEIFVSQASIVLNRISYENQLIAAKEKAIESDRLKSAFLSNMSHEIRTPMNSILGFSNLILNEELTPDLKSKYASLIDTSGEVLVKLIDDIIDISKIESDQLNITEDLFVVNEIIEELDIEYTSLPSKSGAGYIMEFVNSETNVTIKSDKSRIKQILINLINNSTKYTSKGSIKVWFELINDKILFHVKDSGIGIEKDKQEIIFDRYRQADESSTRPYRGTGLGLAISKHLSNLLNGDIIVNSQKNKGAEFIVSIPTNIKSEQNITKSFIKPHNTTNIDWSDKLVYIAEDEVSNYYLLEAYLKRSGVKYEWFKDGKELLARVNKKQPDLILLDLKMPIMDGYEAAIKIRQKHPDLIIIAQTAYAMANEKEKAIISGCNDFITKPIKKEVLFYKMGKYLN